MVYNIIHHIIDLLRTISEMSLLTISNDSFYVFIIGKKEKGKKLKKNKGGKEMKKDDVNNTE